MNNIFSVCARVDEMEAELKIAALEREGKLIRNRSKEIKVLAAMPTAAAQQEHIDYIRLNYADAADAADAANDGPDALELVLYGEENNVDITTDAGLRKAMAALKSA